MSCSWIVRLRPAEDEDRAWICSCWRESLTRKTMPRRAAHAVANVLYGVASLAVVEMGSDPAVLVGFRAMIDGEVVALYVSRQFQPLGIEAMLQP